ncbi:Uu.00g059040.m01.CDS01 [Anthostomella pinea]|uniref:Uu.00g059040.m01.CDS01 n=1 Tax=Anthostomella pinea TaxID=933095 RepID=A0AAI8VSS9_9PEZI|nr:Uu.00g059040.m01.CDS01 [Anthostomella pinea]
MADVYRRSGRGGAGNFYSQKDIDDVVNRAGPEDDLEAQKASLPIDDTPTDPADAPAPAPAPAPTPTAPQSQPQSQTPYPYARSGRGGAGNFIDTTVLPPLTTGTTNPLSMHPVSPSPNSTPNSTTTSTSTSTPTLTAPARSVYSGRGGAGNWTSSGDSGEVYDAEQERRRKQALDGDILRDIRENLPLPPRIHYTHGPGRGRRPEHAVDS